MQANKHSKFDLHFQSPLVKATLRDKFTNSAEIKISKATKQVHKQKHIMMLLYAFI